MEWYMGQDCLSVHVGINHRLWLCRQRKETPVRILLGREHTYLFMREKGWRYIPRGPHFYGPKNHLVPLVFNVSGIYGIAVESVPKPVPEKKKRSP